MSMEKVQGAILNGATVDDMQPFLRTTLQLVSWKCKRKFSKIAIRLNQSLTQILEVKKAALVKNPNVMRGLHYQDFGGDTHRMEKYAWNSAKSFYHLEVEYGENLECWFHNVRKRIS